MTEGAGMKTPEQIVKRVFKRWRKKVTPSWGRGIYTPSDDQFAAMAVEAINVWREQAGATPQMDRQQWTGLITPEQAREWAGFGVDMDQLAECIPRSSIPEAIGVIANEAIGEGRRPGDRRAAGRTLQRHMKGTAMKKTLTGLSTTEMLLGWVAATVQGVRIETTYPRFITTLTNLNDWMYNGATICSFGDRRIVYMVGVPSPDVYQETDEHGEPIEPMIATVRGMEWQLMSGYGADNTPWMTEDKIPDLMAEHILSTPGLYARVEVFAEDFDPGMWAIAYITERPPGGQE